MQYDREKGLLRLNTWDKRNFDEDRSPVDYRVAPFLLLHAAIMQRIADLKVERAIAASGTADALRKSEINKLRTDARHWGEAAVALASATDDIEATYGIADLPLVMAEAVHLEAADL
jgi:hypothetical protein